MVFPSVVIKVRVPDYVDLINNTSVINNNVIDVFSFKFFHNGTIWSFHFEKSMRVNMTFSRQIFASFGNHIISLLLRMRDIVFRTNVLSTDESIILKERNDLRDSQTIPVLGKVALGEDEEFPNKM